MGPIFWLILIELFHGWWCALFQQPVMPCQLHILNVYDKTTNNVKVASKGKSSCSAQYYYMKCILQSLQTVKDWFDEHRIIYNTLTDIFLHFYYISVFLVHLFGFYCTKFIILYKRYICARLNGDYFTFLMTFHTKSIYIDTHFDFHSIVI